MGTPLLNAAEPQPSDGVQSSRKYPFGESQKSPGVSWVNLNVPTRLWVSTYRLACLQHDSQWGSQPQQESRRLLGQWEG